MVFGGGRGHGKFRLAVLLLQVETPGPLLIVASRLRVFPCRFWKVLACGRVDVVVRSSVQ